MRLFSLIACALLLAASPCLAGDTSTTVKSRGLVRCGVASDVPGFAVRDASGRWAGLDVDFCHAVAAAVLGDPAKVSFLPLATSARFTALMAREVDLLSRNTTWSLSREAMLGVEFSGPMLFTGLAFMVPAMAAGGGLKGLDGATVGAVRGTTHVQNLDEMAVTHGMRFKIVLYDSVEQARDAFFAGQCQALSEDAVLLAAFRSQAPGGPDEYTILPERLSKEPISPAVLRGDAQWSLTVKCVLAALITAEECAITREAAANGVTPSSNPAGALFLRRADALAKPLGLEPGWALRAIRAVGNYGEIYERNLGSGSPLKLERGVNRLWSRGGLLFAPPF
ncbi:amino acid ABC transporter substrate-binding protein [Fundidesulfovibrio terrae]|uniref:amino acid ABC transporter substrate-binding protein n=1 Tax=Fundidesulfovibrio terrae TaxID=2922866 RepID=UPI001FAFA9A5|nr:amino acid ABC transporter substrate-binding protein [Fundidesulfovibrio terrae]